MAGEQEAQRRQGQDEVRNVMAFNNRQNKDRVLGEIQYARSRAQELNLLAGLTGIREDDLEEFIKTNSKKRNLYRRALRLKKDIGELELEFQGTSTSEQNRLAKESASRRASSIKQTMSFNEKLGGLGYKLDSRGNLIEASRYDYLRQKYYNRYAEFGDDGEVENRSEASRIASILARRQVRNEREEEERKRQEKENAEKTSRQEANIAARGRYRDAMRETRDSSHMERRRLYESFLEVDESTGKSSLDQRKAAAKKAREVLAAEKANTKGVNENTKALFGLRAFLGPYAKLAMPFYAAKMLYQTGAASTDASLERVQRRTFGGLYGASRDRRGYRRMFNAMTSYGASEQDVMREYAGQKKWASTLMFGMGFDKIEALAMVLGKAPGPAEMRDPELMQKWLQENMRGITDMQAMQLSAMGVASDAFIESARKGQAVDIEGRTATARETYNVLGKQTGNPLKKLGYKVAADQAYAIESASSGNAGKAFSIAALGSNYRLYDQAMESERSREKNYDESIELIPRQTSVTVNINGNIDSEERAHSFAEQIGAEVNNAEK